MLVAGANMFSQLGIHLQSHKVIHNFVQVVSNGAKALAAGSGHSMVLMQHDSVWAVGRNMFGQLGDGTNTDRHNFVKVIPSGGMAMAAGAKHSVVAMRDGSVWATGFNLYGQLGDGTKVQRSTFVKVML